MPGLFPGHMTLAKSCSLGSGYSGQDAPRVHPRSGGTSHGILSALVLTLMGGGGMCAAPSDLMSWAVRCWGPLGGGKAVNYNRVLFFCCLEFLFYIYWNSCLKLG